jgi:hypothetical protein
MVQEHGLSIEAASLSEEDALQQANSSASTLLLDINAFAAFSRRSG